MCSIWSDNVDSVRPLIRDVHKQLKADFKFRDDERYWHAGCTAMIAGAILAGRAGIIQYPIEALSAVLKGMVENARKLIHDNIRTAEDVLNAYVREFYGKFVVVKALEGGLAASIGENGVIDQSLTKTEVAGGLSMASPPGMLTSTSRSSCSRSIAPV
jgi:hypothetical protein